MGTYPLHKAKVSSVNPPKNKQKERMMKEKH